MWGRCLFSLAPVKCTQPVKNILVNSFLSLVFGFDKMSPVQLESLYIIYNPTLN